MKNGLANGKKVILPFMQVVFNDGTETELLPENPRFCVPAEQNCGFFSLSVLSFSANRIPKSQTLKPEVTLINAAMKHGGDVETRKPVGV